MSTVEPSSVESRWWLLVALALVVQALAVCLFALSLYTVLASLGVAPAFPLDSATFLRARAPVLVLTVLATVGGIVGLRLDATRVARADVGWEPSARRYVWGSVAAALFVPPLVPVIAGYYLSQRYRHVGRP